MNKNTEITKIKVSNGQELVAKVREYKNSGGEWKLLERYFTLPVKGKTDREKGWSKKHNSEGFIISNGKQKVEVFLESTPSEITNLLTDGWDQLKAIFPEISRTSGGDFTHFYLPAKKIEKQEDLVLAGRFLNAWSVADIFKIMSDYYKENKAEIKKVVSSVGLENSLKHWIKVSDDAEGNIYIWVGKRNEEIIDIDGGGELQICINRKDLEGYSTSNHNYTGRTIFWKNLDNKQLVNELLERITSFWYLMNSGGKRGAISVCDDHQVGFTQTPGYNSDLPDRETYFPIKDPKLPSKNNNSKSNNSELENIKRIFLEKNIRKIVFEEGKLTIEYIHKVNSSKAVNNQQFHELEKYCREHNKHEIDRRELAFNSNNTTNSNPNQGNYQLIIGLSLGAGAVILGVLVAYFIRKRNKK